MEHTGPGKAVTKMTEEKKRKVIRAVKNKVGVSQRLLARRFGCSRSLIQKVLKEADITYKRRQKAPKVTLKQAMVQKTRIRNLPRGPLCASKPVDVVMDDESYFTYSGSQMPGNVGFYAGPAGDAPEHVKFKPTMKFPKRVMVWLAMSPRGLSSPVFQKKSQTVDGDFYREKIIKKELMPFLREKYPENDFIFWPDLATAHYARATHAAPGRPGHTVRLQRRQPTKCSTTTAHRGHVGHNQTRSVPGRLVCYDRRPADPPDTLRHQISRPGSAAQNDGAPPSARAQRCPPWGFFSGALMDSDAPRSGHSEDVFGFTMVRVLRKIQPFYFFPDFKWPPVR